jgi:signal transduction histidine kinase
VADWPGALARARREAGASELELFDVTGEPMAADPHPAPVEHWPTAAELERARHSMTEFGPIGAPVPRLLHYAEVDARGRPLLLRFATEVPELGRIRDERRQVLLAHAVGVVVLLVAAGMALLPGAAGLRDRTRALDAYEEAMSRLQSRGVQHRAELVRLGEELEDTAAMARSGELAAGIAHEMRNGLGTILTQARLLEATGADPGAVAEAARGIREECETLESVIRRFVDFVREERLERAEFDLSGLLRRVVAREGRSHPGREVSLAAAEGTRIVADEDLLERGLENLVRNALEAAGPGGRVEVRVIPVPAGLEIQIADDGPGFPAGAQPPRPFTTGKAGGLGLGLPLALKVMQLHGGSLELEPRLPRGALVRIRLPAEPVATEGNTYT